MVQKIDFRVVGEDKMHCVACETRVKFALSRLDGVQDVLASAKTQHIAVVIDPDKVTVQDIADRLKAAGFEATQTTP